MYTELTLHFKQDLPENMLEAFEQIMGTSKDFQEAIKHSIHLDEGFNVFLPDIVYTGISKDKLFVILRGDDIRTLKIHLENKDITSTSKVSGLKDCIDAMHQTINMFSKRNKIKIRNIKAVIVAEGEQIEKGSLKNRFEYIKSIIKDEFEQDLILAIVIFLVSLANYLGGKTNPDTSLEDAIVSAGTNVIVLVIAAVIILGARLMFYKPVIEFK